MSLLLVLVSLLAIAAIGYVRAWRSRRRLEFRARLLETLAIACRRGRALPPLLAAAAEEQSPRLSPLVEAMVEALAAGEPLAGALARAGERFIGSDVVGAVSAAQGTDALPATLAALARDDGRALEMRHRLYLVALYPALLLLLAFGLQAGVTAWAEVLPTWKSRPFIQTMVFPVAWLVAGSAAVWLVGDRLHRRGRLPGTRLLSFARVLRTAGLLADAGLPLPQALRRAVPATRHRGLARRTAEAAGLLEAGAPLEQAQARLGLPRAWILRIEAAGATGVGALLTRLSERCLARHRARGERFMRWAAPLVLLLVGGAVLLNFETVMGHLLSVQQEARRGLRLW